MARCVGTGALDISPNRSVELLEHTGFDVELPLQVGPQADGRRVGDTAGLSVVPGELESERKGRNEEVGHAGSRSEAGWVGV